MTDVIFEGKNKRRYKKMKKIEWQDEHICTVCGYSSRKFPGYDEIKFCPICKTWGDDIVPINAETCCRCGQEFAEIGENICKWCKQLEEQRWEDDYWETAEEESRRESAGFEENAKRLAGKWYCWDCGYSGDEEEFKMIDEHNVQCPQCQSTHTTPATSPQLTMCENCGTIIPVKEAEENCGLCESCREAERETTEMIEELFL
jgi:rubrerythrin